MSLLKTIGIVGSVAGVLLLSNVALAEEGTPSLTRERQSSNRVAPATTTRNARVETAREGLKTSREEAKARIETAREEAKAGMRIRREEAKERMETVREEAKTRMETAREEAKQRLSGIRDRAKQQRAERLAEQFDRLNKKWTDHFIQLLDRYEAISLKIQERADSAETNGKDVTASRSSIVSALTAIENARDAVVAQAAKVYTLDASPVTAEAATADDQDKLVSGLRTAFQDLHKTLFNDLFALRDGAMKDARVAVQAALQALSQIPKVDDDDDDTSTDDSNQ